MSRYIYAHDNVAYYHLPIEAWRGLMDEPARVFTMCEGIMCADCTTTEEVEEVYGLRLTEEEYQKHKQKGHEFLDRNKLSRVCFSIQVEMYWQYKSDFKSGRMKEWDWLLMLCWMALHTIGGGTTIKDTSNEYVFCRAAGFAKLSDKQFNGDERILRYMVNPARYAARMRDDLMLRYDTFHAYSQKGRRGWCYMLAGIDRQQAFDMLAQHMAERGTKTQRKHELMRMMRTARRNVENNK